MYSKIVNTFTAKLISGLTAFVLILGSLIINISYADTATPNDPYLEALKASTNALKIANQGPIVDKEKVANAKGVGSVKVSTNLTKGSWYIQLGGSIIDSGGHIQSNSSTHYSGQKAITHSIPEGNYTLTYGSVTGYTAPKFESITVTAGKSLTYYGIYTPKTGNIGSIKASTNLTKGSWKILKGGVEVDSGGHIQSDSTTHYSGQVPITHSLPVGTYTLSYGSVSGYVTPSTKTITLSSNQNLTYYGVYTPKTGDIGSIKVSTNLNEGSWKILKGGVEVDSGGATSSSPTAGQTPITHSLPVGSYTLTYGNVTGYTTPSSKTITLLANQNLNYYGTYTKTSSTKGTLKINQSPVNATVHYSGPSVGFTTTNLVTNVNPTSSSNSYGITITNIPSGYVLDAITDGVGNPLNIKPYNQNLSAGGTITYNIKYKASTVPPNPSGAPVKITKTKSEIVSSDNNKTVTYNITVERLDSGTSNLDVAVTDTITGTKKLPVDNGGSFTYQSGTYSCTGTCSSAGTDGIASQAVTVKLASKGSKATIAYTMASNNAGQPAASPATFKNTAKGTYKNPTTSKSESVTASVTVRVNGRVLNGGNGSSSSSSGGGGGGYVYVGDMILQIQKLVSLTPSSYRDASTKSNALVLPKNKTSRVYTKILITNKGIASAKDIKMTPFFTNASSIVATGSFMSIKGGTAKGKSILIDLIPVNKTAVVTYSLLVKESGNSSNYAVDGIELTDFKSKLAAINNGLTYKGKGKKYLSFLNAGNVNTPGNNNGSSALKIYVYPDKTQARVGETVNYTITAKNVSSSDLTDVYLSHQYPKQLKVTNTGGGKNDSRAVQWKTPILRSGKSVTYKMSAKLVSGTPGVRIKSLTSATVNEVENIPPVSTYLTIIGSGGGARLAQTGPMSTLLVVILGTLAYMGYALSRRKRRA